MTRRKFLKACLTAAGLTALGGCNLRSWARGMQEQRAAPNAPQDWNGYEPRYLTLEASGELERRERALWAKMENCGLCPRMCGVNRMAGKTGVCNTSDIFRVAFHGPHFGEERPFIGRGGSGTIFFANCNLLCIFCQNYRVSHLGDGIRTSHTRLAEIMIALQERGCHNINLVTPTHVVPHIVTALRLAIAKGLYIPLLYNTSGYELLEVVQLLDGIIDLYVPDFKFQDNERAARLTNGAPDYTLHTAAAIKEMHRQTGTLWLNNGVAYRGLLIRHLVMPENYASTDVFVRWVARELGVNTHVNIMRQWSPLFQARYHPPLNRSLRDGEFEQAKRWARSAGLRNFH